MIGGLPFGPDCLSNSTQRLESPRQVGPSGFSSLYIFLSLYINEPSGFLLPLFPRSHFPHPPSLPGAVRAKKG